MRRVRLSAVELATLAAGYGSAAALTELRAGQLAVRRLQLRAVAQRSGLLPDVVHARLDAAMALLERTARAAPETAADILAYPLLSAWATACLGRLVSPDVPTAVPLDIEFGYLGGLAAAGAARAGIEFELAVPVWDGSVFLPTLGVVDLGCSGVATIRGDATGFTVAVADRAVTVSAPYHVDRPGWRARRTVRIAPDLTLAVEDTDPYGACFGRDHADRLTPAEFDRLRTVLVPAWRLIEKHHADYALGIRILLQSIVPLATPEDGGSVSAASRVAAGAVSLSIPDDPAELALLLIHEVQHMKLGALLDLVDLHAVDGPARHHAPWRADPRPVGALFQGVYAHLGVADFWRVRRRYTVGGTADRAEYEFAYWCEQTRRAAATLADCGELTEVGAGFVARLGDTLALWRDEPVAPSVAGGVADLLLASAVDWRLRNYVPADREAARLAEDRLAGR
ncbi:MAG TPA: HEXXH motif domain-containing protein, partial [Nakamurella sp.]